jgi:hypothetical protein
VAEVHFIMRRILFLITIGIGFAGASLYAQGRPFGKYFVRACTVADGVCVEAMPSINNRMPQTITLKQVGCAGDVTPCDDPVVYPLVKDSDFYVSAISDSGLTVTQYVPPSVNVSLVGPPVAGVQKYHLNGPGNVVIRATQAGDMSHKPANPVRILLPAPATPSKDDATCTGLFSKPSATAIQQLDATAIIGLIGSPTPFVLAAQGKDTIFIYSTRALLPNDADEQLILSKITLQIEQLLRQTPDALGISPASDPFHVELKIAHAVALGDPAARISALNYSQFKVVDIGSDSVRISASAQPDCTTWTAFLTGIRQLEWQGTPEPLEMKLFYLSSTDAATAFGGLGSGGGTAAAPAPNGTPAPSASGGTSAAGNATVAVTQPPGSVVNLISDTTPCVIAGLTISNSSACAGAASGSASGSPGGGGDAAVVAQPKPAPIAMSAMAVAAGTSEQSPSDLLVFSDANPGDDAQVLERKRILSLLDLPRPEMIINAWVMQNSTANPTAMGKFNKAVSDLVTEYNRAVERVVLDGWASVKIRTQADGYFNDDFYHYVTDHYVADTYSSAKTDGSQQAAQKFLDHSAVRWADPPASRQDNFGICGVGKYCLGYDRIFQPLKPSLTDFLLTLIAAKDSLKETLAVIREVESSDPCQALPQSDPLPSDSCHAQTKPVEGQLQSAQPPRKPSMFLTEKDCEAKTLSGEVRERCRAIWANLGLDNGAAPNSCAVKDLRWIMASIPEIAAQLGTSVSKPKPSSNWDPPKVYLECLWEAANTFLPRSGADLMRADVADFLFNYKISQQYPHEFVPYDLSHSADALNTALSPLIDAFNRDIVAFQTFMRADLQYQVDRLNSASDERCCAKRLFGLDKPSFFNDGLVSVRTISGQPTSVATNSLSFLDASTAPTLANLANNIASSASGSGIGASPVASVLGSKQPSAALLTGVLNSYQTTYAQIGRGLNLQVTPRSLSTASSAELSVALNADDSSGGITYSGGPQGGTAPNTSHVAQFDTSTRIRVESVKLFQMSSFSAIVERSRSRFPLLPPFVEVPYIGTFMGIPMVGAKEYHSSVAVMSAMVVPTAADIAYGLRFTTDQVLDGSDSGATTCSFVKGSAGPSVTNTCRFRRAVSLRDLNEEPIPSFHKSMTNCLAGVKSPFATLASLNSKDSSACADLTFASVPR